MALQYFLEYNKDSSTPYDMACYIQLRRNVPIYQSRIDKEDYDVSDSQHEFLTGLFNVSGVVEVSSRAYRVWIMKSPVFTWEEVMLPVLHFMKDFYGEETIEQLPGSANPDHLGSAHTVPLVSPVDRRKL